MENEFKRILTLLDKLNDNAPKKIISSSELQSLYATIEKNGISSKQIKHNHK